MNQGIAIAAGSGGSGGGDGGAGEGGDGEGAGDGSGGDDASGDNRNAPDKEKYPTCGTESHPVDVVTGQVFTHPTTDLHLPGPLPFTFQRSYSSTASKKDQGLGWGWAHSLGWFVEVERRRVRVWNEKGVSVTFPVPEVGHSVLGEWGWALRRERWGFAVDANDEVWRIFSVTFDEGKTFRLSAIDDRNKNRIALTYDEAKLVEVEDSAGRIIKVTSTKEGHITSLQVKNAEHQGQWVRFARYEYDDAGRLVRVTDADDHAWTYAYDEFNRLVRDTDRAALSFCFRYDAQDRGIEAWGEYIGKKDPSLADDVPKFLYDKRTRAKGIYHRKFDYARGYTEVTDTTEVRRYYGNAKEMLDKAVTGGAVTSSKYDERGFEVEKTDPLGATAYWMRDARGRVLATVDALGRRITIERDESGRPIVITDAAGGVTRAWRNQRGQSETVQDPAGGVTVFAWTEKGMVAAITVPTGATTRYTYDARGNLREIVHPNGGVWTMTYDGLGRRLTAKNPAGGETRYAYSERGDITAVFDANGDVTRYSYDGERRLTQIVTPAGHVTQLTWGGYQALCARRDANGHVLRLVYSREGELSRVINEREEVHQFHYDTAGRLVGEETFDGRTFRYRNDAAGRRMRVENGAGEVTELVYDPAGQLVERHLPDSTAEVFEYDQRGYLSRAMCVAGEFTFARDAVGRVVREEQRVAGEAHWVEVEYDPAGNRVGRRTSAGHVERIERDISGARVLTLLGEDCRVEQVNDVLSREVQRKLPDGGVIESAFDALGRLTQRRARSVAGARGAAAGEPLWLGRDDAGVTARTSYRYDMDGNLVASTDERRGQTSFECDPLGQLLAVLPEKVRAEVFRYDPAGNVCEAAGAAEREYGLGNRLLRKGNVAYVWDDEGRLVQRRENDATGGRVWSYSWDGGGLLKSVGLPEGGKVEFDYDPFARRVAKRWMKRDGVAWRVMRDVRFVWDGNTLLHEIRRDAVDRGDDVVSERTYCFDDEGFTPLAHRQVRDDVAGEGREWFHYVNDPVGSPDRMVASDGTVVCELDRSAWGTTQTTGARASTPLRFQGQYEDEETDLFYNRYRYYDPATGRYISRDPIELRGGCLNAFAYAPNPMRWVDPLGLAPAIPTLAPPADPTANVGSMNGQAVQHLLDARAAGATPAEMADMYDGMKKQIETEAANRKQDWSASRAACADGSQAFLGSKGPALVITPAGQIATGTALGGPNNLVDVSKVSFGAGGLVFPAPNLAAAKKVL